MTNQPRPELRRTGLGVSAGIAFGRAYLIGRDAVKTPRHHIEVDDIDTENARLHRAIAASDRSYTGKYLKDVLARMDEHAPRKATKG